MKTFHRWQHVVAVAISISTAIAVSGPGAAPALAQARNTPAPAAAAASADPNSPAVRDAWRSLALQDDPALREKLLGPLLKLFGNSPSAVGRLIASDDAYGATKPGQSEHKLTFIDPADKKSYDVSFAIIAPPGYSPDKPWPVLLAAHGEHGNGPNYARSALKLLGSDADKYIVVAPTLPGPRQYSAKSYQEQAYLQPLRWVKRHMNVDDSRTYLAGYSLGGHTTWHVATLFPREFAAAVAMAGITWFEGWPHTANMYLGNLSNLPLWSIWGELDKPAAPAIGQVQFNRSAAEALRKLGNDKFRGTELRGVGHAGCEPKAAEFAAFLAGAAREPAPEKFSHSFHFRHHARGYYIEATTLVGEPMRMDKPIRISFDHKPTTEESDRKFEDYFRRFLYSFSAELDRGANTLTVKLSRVRAVRLYVIDGMFDLTRPVTIKIGPRTWRGTIAASAECMLKHYAAERDGSAIVVNELDVDDLGRAVARYK